MVREVVHDAARDNRNVRFRFAITGRDTERLVRPQQPRVWQHPPEPPFDPGCRAGVWSVLGHFGRDDPVEKLVRVTVVENADFEEFVVFVQREAADRQRLQLQCAVCRG